MALFRASAEVDAPASAVWTVLTDWEVTRDWMWPPTTVEVMGERRIGIGTRLFAITTVFGLFKLRDFMVVTDWVEGLRIRVRHVGWLVRGDGIFEVEPLGEARARFTWIEDMPMPFGLVGELFALMARPIVERYVRKSCARVAELSRRRA